jgi:glycosyltransferase involved in cell wall biosynthesis
MKKVLVLCPNIHFGQGGVSNYYSTLKLDNEPGITYFHYDTDSKSKVFKTCNALLKYILFKLKAPFYQTIHLNPSFNTTSFYRDLMFILVALFWRKEIIIFYRGWNDIFEQNVLTCRFKRWLFKISFAKAHKTIVLGTLFKDKLIHLGLSKRSKVFIESTVADNSSFDQHNFESKLTTFKNKEITLLFLSRIVEQKGVYILADTFKLLLEKHPEFSFNLIIAGDGPELENLKSYVKKKRIKRIQFCGYVKTEEKSQLLLKSHIMFFPTNHGEGLPNCLLEGMLFGLGIVSRPVGGIADWIEHKKNGYIINSLSASDFENEISKLIQNPNAFEEMSKLNTKKAKETFTVEKVKQRLFNIYKS